MTTIVLKGPFTTDEIRRITALCQDIESMRPTELFRMFVDAQDMEGEVETLMREMNPDPLPGYTRTEKRWDRSKTEHPKTYRGIAKTTGNWVYVDSGDTAEPLTHIVRHSPDGFSWGFHGSGPAELAHCILVDFLGGEVEPAVYQAFKADVIAALPEQRWELHSDFINEWLETWKEKNDG